MNENCLRVGEIYETVIGGASGKALYIGKTNSKGIKYHHFIIFRKEELQFVDRNPDKGVITVRRDETGCWRFSDYAIECGKLKIKDGIERRLSCSEREFINERVKRSNL